MPKHCITPQFKYSALRDKGFKLAKVIPDLSLAAQVGNYKYIDIVLRQAAGYFQIVDINEALLIAIKNGYVYAVCTFLTRNGFASGVDLNYNNCVHIRAALEQENKFIIFNLLLCTDSINSINNLTYKKNAKIFDFIRQISSFLQNPLTMAPISRHGYKHKMPPLTQHQEPSETPRKHLQPG